MLCYRRHALGQWLKDVTQGAADQEVARIQQQQAPQHAIDKDKAERLAEDKHNATIFQVGACDRLTDS